MQFSGQYSVHLPNQFKQRSISLAVSILLGLSVVMFVDVASAETTTASEFKKVYKIGAGPLGNALTSFASQSGVVLSFDPSLTEDKQTVGLDGAYSLQEGFDALLQNSDLAVVRGNGSGYLLKKSSKQEIERCIGIARGGGDRNLRRAAK